MKGSQATRPPTKGSAWCLRVVGALLLPMTKATHWAWLWGPVEVPHGLIPIFPLLRYGCSCSHVRCHSSQTTARCLHVCSRQSRTWIWLKISSTGQSPPGCLTPTGVILHSAKRDKHPTCLVALALPWCGAAGAAHHLPLLVPPHGPLGSSWLPLLS